ncbi:MAG TPA: hypothetical protein PKN60_12330 [Bacteroidales bacterium]|nr:hypothetical protein [Bacteroidales bacterium]
MAFQVKSFKELITLTKEKLEESMIPLRVRSAKAKAEIIKVELETKLADLEMKINEKAAQRDIEFLKVIELVDEYELTERRLKQVTGLVTQLFPDS